MTFQVMPWMIALLPVSLVLLRQFSSFYYRTLMTTLSMIVMATYGMIAALLFPLVGCTHYIHFTVARGYYYLGLLFCGIQVVPEGIENLNVQGPAILVCNHQSSLDIMLMGKVYPKNTTIIAKKELKYYPFLGWFMQLSRVIFLDRKNRENAIKEARKAAEDIHKKNVNVWVFPEGTRGHESEINLLPFKKGPFYMAVQAKVPIIPIVIANYSHLYSAKEKKYQPGVVRCKILPPISTETIEEESTSIEKLATDCRQQMLDVLKDITPIETVKKTQ
ncbi:hypothetical protein G6F62_010056 [Rhizopus arrhizus]|uniref:1-acyl-sn-glycerol-3-phosphate acyltransferase n=1 Tax=Rhizopus oryzae TaxID=64495 RepID=A0A9P6XCI1_RHIOR|nr:hypothetical protein G6F23_003442 [Rhizopus arrhizus]KAG0755007.1 hypothetical protein G6F24_012114 [Rhizopus arrhizus]KAG0913815.1 hypothetical protein G6F33_004817 [Rhizopus arrhizus]KAG0942257.1 hypothetical protein G6F32_008112 [Rhizopus arrhizus]KAG1295658.1 hypothetical protein G6F66_004139 [Rhizopus arrhizus]